MKASQEQFQRVRDEYLQTNSPFGPLPEEILYGIFSYLTFNQKLCSVVSVCRRWRNLYINNNDNNNNNNNINIHNDTSERNLKLSITQKGRNQRERTTFREHYQRREEYYGKFSQEKRKDMVDSLLHSNSLFDSYLEDKRRSRAAEAELRKMQKEKQFGKMKQKERTSGSRTITIVQDQ